MMKEVYSKWILNGTMVDDDDDYDDRWWQRRRWLVDKHIHWKWILKSELYRLHVLSNEKQLKMKQKLSIWTYEKWKMKIIEKRKYNDENAE